MNITPLDAWIKGKIGQSEKTVLSDESLHRHQTQKLREVMAYVRRHSPFYRKHLAGLPRDFPKFSHELEEIPFTTETDLKNHYLDMLCVSQSQIARVVSLFPPGSATEPKRLYFTDPDIELTIDFFHHGMTTLTRPNSRVLILMPGKTPGSLGDLLRKALSRMDCEGHIYGLVNDSDNAMEVLLDFRPQTIVGLPGQMLELARHPKSDQVVSGSIHSILLSAEYVPASIVVELQHVFETSVFEHYGMTEMGLGGGVQCEAKSGYHLREADLLFEVVDPKTGAPLSRDEEGEVVFTTLTRQGMPLIRYRTGDLARFITEPCPCGTCLKRLGKVSGRVQKIAPT